jgi:NADH-quinone oxidoreductase subunit G
VLRVLGNLLELPGFDHDSAEQVRAEALGDGSALASRLDNRSAAPLARAGDAPPLERIADVPIYAADALVRRAGSLQLTADARPPQASLPSALWAELGLQPGEAVRVSRGGQALVIAAVEDPALAANAVRVPAGHADTAALGAMFGALSVARA